MDTLREEPTAYRVSPPKRELWSHEFLDALSLVKHRAVAEAIQGNSALIEIARANANRWLASGNYDEGEAQSVREWLPLLEPDRFDGLIDALNSDSENATRMRQSSPFTGIVSNEAYRAMREQLIQEWSDHAA